MIRTRLRGVVSAGVSPPSGNNVVYGADNVVYGPDNVTTA